jgi:hypothetical protein
MIQRTHQIRSAVSLVILAIVAATAAVLAQQEPVATMFREDLKRGESLAQSFHPIELPAAGAAPALHVYLSAGDLERAFDTASIRPDAAIIPTNTSLVITAASPSSQRVLTERVSKQPTVMADLQEQIAARRKQTASGGDVMQVGIDSFFAQLPRSGNSDAKAMFPRMACLIATAFPTGDAVDRRELYAQDRVRKGVAGCLAALDAAGAQSVMMPLLGAASARSQSKDAMFEGQRLLKECRHINAVAGIALGIHDFAVSRKTLREIGIVQWDKEITDMFGTGRVAQSAYRLYAEQIKAALNKGMAGQKTGPGDVDGNCTATLIQ